MTTGMQPAHPDASDDVTLLADLRAGNTTAFERLVRLHGPRMLRLARHLSTSEDRARQVVRDALAAAHVGRGALDEGPSLRARLGRLVVTRALDGAEASPAAIADLVPHFLPGGHFVDPPSAWPAFSSMPSDQARALLRRCLDRLPAGARVAIVLRDVEEMSLEEVAACLGTSVQATRERIHRARQALITLLDPHLRGTAP